MTHEIPTLKEELERKSVEALEFAVHRHEQHLLSDRELGVIGHAVWNITGGLVDDSVSDLAALVAKTRHATPIKRHFAGKGAIYTVAYRTERDGFVVVKRDARTPKERQVVRNSDAQAGDREDQLKTLFAAFKTGGYVEL
jgi:hypothetical protein